MKMFITSIALFASISVYSQDKIVLTSTFESPTQILSKLTNIDFKRSQSVILDTGLKNACHQYRVIKDQLEFLSKLNLNFKVINNKTCFGGASVIRTECKKHKSCSVIESYEVNDQ